MMFHKNAEQQKPTFTGTVPTGVEAKEKRTSVVSLIGDEKNEKQKNMSYSIIFMFKKRSNELSFKICKSN